MSNCKAERPLSVVHKLACSKKNIWSIALIIPSSRESAASEKRMHDKFGEEVCRVTTEVKKDGDLATGDASVNDVVKRKRRERPIKNG